MYRIGLGYDIHRFAEGRKLILGGVEIPSDLGLLGHSDADVLSHAIADAILGAVGLPDIGTYFPPSNAALAGMDSQIIVKRAQEEALRRGYHIVNIDCAIIAEKPKIGSYREAMQEKLAKTLGMHFNDIGIKATTNEGLGALGNAEGIAAHATCLVVKR